MQDDDAVRRSIWWAGFTVGSWTMLGVGAVVLWLDMVGR